MFRWQHLLRAKAVMQQQHSPRIKHAKLLSQLENLPAPKRYKLAVSVVAKCHEQGYPQKGTAGSMAAYTQRPKQAWAS